MAIITIVPEIVADTTALIAQQWLADFTDYHGYKALLEDGTPNPVTRAQHRQAVIRRFLKDSIKAQRAVLAAEAARQNSLDATETEITLT